MNPFMGFPFLRKKKDREVGNSPEYLNSLFLGSETLDDICLFFTLPMLHKVS